MRIYIAQLILLILAQVIVFNSLQFSTFVYVMIYPLFLLLMPFNLGILSGMALGFIYGLVIDYFSNTFGLHASACILIMYMRPTILKYISPKNGYDLTLIPSIRDMGNFWFLYYASIMLFIHNFWFFLFEYFSLSNFFLVLLKTLASVAISVFFMAVWQFVLLRPSKSQ